MFMIIKFRELICVKIFNYDFYYSESWSCLDFVDLAIAICTSFCLEKYYIKREEKILTQMKERQKKIKYKIIIGLYLISIIAAYIFFIILI